MILTHNNAIHSGYPKTHAYCEGDKAQQQKLFSKLIEGCVSCHAQYALDRFPGLRKADQ